MTSSSIHNGQLSTIATIIKSGNLSEVVTIRQGKEGHEEFCRIYHYLEEGTEVLLQAIQKITCGRIKVLPFYDNEQMQNAKGAEYVMEHETYVDEEFLIPLKYQGKVRFVQRPGSRGRYVIGSQLLSERPRFVRTGEETTCFKASSLNRTTTIPAKTILQLVREFRCANGGNTYMELSDGQEFFAINETDPINFTCVEDQKEYSLYELVHEKMLPRAIMIDELPPEDAILVDQELNSAMMTCFDGPIELLGFQDVEVLVGWIRDRVKKVYRIVLIPKISWQTTLAERKHFGNENEKTMYIMKKYGQCTDYACIEKKMYFMKPTLTDITWLRNPAHYGRPKNDMEFYDFLPNTFQESSDEDQGTDILQSAMQGKEMTSFLPKNTQQKPRLKSKDFCSRKTSDSSKQKEKRKKEKQTSSHETPSISPPDEPDYSVISNDVPSPCMNTSSLSTNTLPYPTKERTTSSSKISVVLSAKSCDNLKGPNIQRCNKESACVAASIADCGAHNRKGVKSEEGESSQLRSPSSDDDFWMKDVKREEDAVDSDSETYDYPDFKELTPIYTSSKHRPPLTTPPHETPAKDCRVGEDVVGSDSETYDYPDFELLTPIYKSSTHRPPLTTPPDETPAKDCSVSETSHQISKHHSLNTKDADNKVFVAEFFQYTTLEVARCLELCALGDFARKCVENRLDGKFFQNLDFLDLKKDPFGMKDFHIVKLKKVIYDGWRPNTGNGNK